MKASEFRKQYAAELNRASAPARASVRSEEAPTTEDVIAVITNRRLGAERRIAAIQQVAAGAVKRPTVMEALIALIADSSEDRLVRQAALATVQASTFKAVDFRRYAPLYNAALRSAATSDDETLRLQALDTLALNKDSYAQQLLLDGLQQPSKALVSPLQAIQMLGYDVHSEHFPVLRDIVETSKRPTLRRAALRLLAADGASAPLMRRIAADKTEDKAARSVAAVALQSLAPKEFAKVARAVVLDDDDDDDVRASVISAISQSGDLAGREVTRKVRDIDATPGGSRQLNRAARQFTEARSPAS